MKINVNEIKKSLEEYKEHFLKKVKEVEGASETKFQELERKMDEKIKSQLAEYKQRKISLPGLEDEKKLKDFRFSKLIEAQLSPKGWDGVKDADFEKEVIDAVAKTHNASTGEDGGFLVPEEVSSEIIDLAIAESPVMEMGPTMMRGLRGELSIPKVTGRPIMYWVGEEEEATESQATFGEITLSPKTAAAFTKISRRLLHQTSGTAERVVRDELAKAFAIGLDEAYLQGLGTEKQPKGIRNHDNLTSTDAIGTNGGRFTIDKAAEMAVNVDVANLLRGNLGYVMRPEVLSGMLRERVEQFSGQSPDGQPISSSQIILSRDALESTLGGWKIRTTTLLPGDLTKGTLETASPVIFGDWSQLVIAMWEGFELRASDSAGNSSGSAFTQRQIWLSAFQGVDVNIKDQGGFTVIEDADISV